MFARLSAQGLVLVAVVALAACSSASVGPTPVHDPLVTAVPSVAPASVAPTSFALATRAPTPAPTPVPATATPTPAPTPVICANPCSVVLVERAYLPSILNVKVGTEVVWTNASCLYGCTVTFTGYRVDSGPMALGATFKHTFGAAGFYVFHCKLDPAVMKGTITVTK